MQCHRVTKYYKKVKVKLFHFMHERGILNQFDRDRSADKCYTRLATVSMYEGVEFEREKASSLSVIFTFYIRDSVCTL